MLWATMIGPNDDDCPVGADEALERLMEGNARFLRGEPRYSRARLATGLLDSFRLSAQIIQQDINADQEHPKRQYKEAQIDVIAAD